MFERHEERLDLSRLGGVLLGQVSFREHSCGAFFLYCSLVIMLSLTAGVYQ